MYLFGALLNAIQLSFWFIRVPVFLEISAGLAILPMEHDYDL